MGKIVLLYTCMYIDIVLYKLYLFQWVMNDLETAERVRERKRERVVCVFVCVCTYRHKCVSKCVIWQILKTICNNIFERFIHVLIPVSVHTFNIIIIIIIIYPLTARVIEAPQMISQPVSSMFLCSPLPSGTWRTPGLSIPWCCLPTSSSSPIHQVWPKPSCIKPLIMYIKTSNCTPGLGQSGDVHFHIWISCCRQYIRSAAVSTVGGISLETNTHQQTSSFLNRLYICRGWG